ncbi:hypothetical protein [Abiotrophia defectiva]|jgi:hypothetical protein|uniref:hypothetical protein n=1 Tax=Abiotrophia defectiva TaxID=46125 RepID=UPI002066D263|nr:hypothetical protein [Abiotrophia defectiva]DAK13528.1 MAG TPA: Protein phosphatase 1 regulatory subunit KINSASE G - I [Caudoviricetes sp.]DAS51179.1 MAG TPA: Protein phosphatase 1 regulatory subunit KINSASE G - I [Caudoviricetes sp.]DAS92178.1 MAG TPA: Protein phosphatase 1 regulatory subunit KINSASE G - I [Caudoviricetes sp.]
MEKLLTDSIQEALAETALELANERANKAMYKKAYEALDKENKELKARLEKLEVQDDVPDSK